MRATASAATAARSPSACTAASVAPARSASSVCSSRAASAGRAVSASARCRARTLAASSTVPPHALAAMTSTASSGRQARRQVSRKVPVVRRTSRAGAPHDTSSSSRRCSRWLRSRSMSRRRSSSSRRSPAAGAMRSRRCRRARSSASGTARRLDRHAAEVLADDEAVVHQPQRRLGAGAEHRQHRVAHLVQAGGGAVAQGGERLGQPGRLDGVRARHVEPLLAQQAGGPHQEAGDGVVGRGEEVAVPAGRGHAGPVAAGLREPGGRPGRPGDRGLRARQALEALVVLGDLRPRGQGGRVPGAADDDDALAALALGGPDRAPHVRLAQQLARRVVGPRRAQLAHRLLDGGERGRGAVAQLDDVLPPALRVRVAGGGGERGEGVAARPARPAARRGRAARAARPRAGRSCARRRRARAPSGARSTPARTRRTGRRWRARGRPGRRRAARPAAASPRARRAAAAARRRRAPRSARRRAAARPARQRRRARSRGRGGGRRG